MATSVHGRDFTWITIISTIVLTLLSWNVKSEKLKPWYRGCMPWSSGGDWVLADVTYPAQLSSFSGQSNNHSASTQLASPPEPLPVICSRHCGQQRFTSAGILNGSQCLCGNLSQISYHAVAESCDISCTENEQLPCGGVSQVSVYSIYGPFFLTSQLRTEDPVVTGDTVTLQVILQLAAPPSVNLGLPTNTSAAAFNRSIEIVWLVEHRAISQVVTTKTQFVQATLSHAFHSAGSYDIVVTASNALSQITARGIQAVVIPAPSDLQVTLLTDHSDLPSCIPAGVKVPDNVQPILVFRDLPVEFEASVTRGRNLTFFWWFMDDGSNHSVLLSEKSTHCTMINCTIVNQKHVFRTRGQFRIIVSVNNSFGQLQKSLHVVVLEKNITNLRVSKSDPSSVPFSPQSTVKYQVSMETADRHHTLLEVDFGDGDAKLYRLGKGRGELIQENLDELNDFLQLQRTDACMLSLQLTHRYAEEGTFTLQIRAYNNHSSVNTSSAPVTVMNTLQHAMLYLPSSQAVGRPTKIEVRVRVSSIFAQYQWFLWNEDGTFSTNITTETAGLTHIFTQRGMYSVRLIASNQKSSVQVLESISIQEPIAGLGLVTSSNKFVVLGSEVSCTATISNGSDVQFIWNFGSAVNDNTIVVNSNYSSSANHTFASPGVYNVSVLAKNSVSHAELSLANPFTVEEPVGGLVVYAPSAIRNGVSSSVTMSATKGTNVKFDVDFGSDRNHFPGDWMGANFTVQSSFRDAKVHIIKVFAYNNVSMVTQAVNVQVQQAVKPVTIATFTEAVVNISFILLAKSEGAVSDRTDILYIWKYGDFVRVSRVPFCEVMLSTTGQVTVTVTARNLVSEKTVNRTIIVGDSPDGVYLRHNTHTALSASTRFSVQNTEAGGVEVHYHPGDSTHQELAYNSPPNQSILHTYTSVGIYKITAEVYAEGGSNVSLSSILSVQEPITGLVLKGPSAVPLHSMSLEHSWVSEHKTGSHVFYQWRFGDTDPILTTRFQMNEKFSKAGEIRVSVTAQNDVSRESADLLLTVQHPVLKVEIAAPTVVEGSYTAVTVTVHGDKDFVMYMDFGDGFRVEINAEAKNITFKEVAGLPFSSPPVYQVLLQHLYDRVGHYVIHANVSNRVSWLENSKTALVDERIGGINLTCKSPSLVAIGDLVRVLVTVASGNDLSFLWDFDDDLSQPIVTNWENRSMAVHIYEDPGVYQISVNVSNPLYKHAIYTKLPFKVVVADPVDAVVLDTVSGKFAAPLKDTQHGQHTDLVEFEASVNEGTDVVFIFDFGDGSPPFTAEGQYDILRLKTYASASHRYTQVGTYQVTAVASNAWGNKTDTKPFYVQIPPEGLDLDKTEYCQQKGKLLWFRASVKAGTNVRYRWDMGDDRVNITSQERRISHKYWESGTYELTVVAYNQVGQLMYRVTVDIEENIQGVELQTEKTLVNVVDMVYFEATASPTGFPRLVRYYEFNFGDSTFNRKTFNNRMGHRYRHPKRYFVTVSAHNCFTTAKSKTLEIHVVEEMGKLTFGIHGELVIGRTVRFEAYTFKGSDITYMWDFGDGSPIQNTSVLNVEHQYQRKGRYEINLFMSNPFGNISHREVVFVLEKSCHPPNIKILWGKGQKVFYSSEVKIEAEVMVNCSITSSAVYKWTLRNGTDRSIIKLSSRMQKQEDDRMFYLPEKTLKYGNHSLMLRVLMKGLIVESAVETWFAVVPTPLVAVISGGIQRQVSQSDSIVMDASKSNDPDAPEAQDFIYTWSCYELLTKNSCFVQSDDSPSLSRLSGKQVTFPGWVLRPNFTEFEFNLTIHREGKGSVSTTQVLILKEGSVLDVQVICQQCDDTEVNADERLILTADCPGCQSEGLEYEWELYRVTDIHDNRRPVENPYSTCVQADGSTWKLMYPNKTDGGGGNMTGDNATMTTVTQPEQKSSTHTSTTTTMPTTTTTAAKNPFGGELPSEGDGGSSRPASGLGLFNIEEDDSGGGSRLPSISEGASGSRADNNQDSGVGFPTEGETGGKREPSNPGQGTDNDKKDKPPSSGSNVDPVVDGTNPWKRNPHIVHRTRYQVNLREEKTTTGIRQKTLVLKPGALEQGGTYILQVLVAHKGSQASGKALAYFYVNESPRMGKCTINLGKGVEMETEFRIFCHDWEDKDEPIQYEVSYLQAERETRDIVYQGLNHIIAFQLPAGSHHTNGTVRVSIAILDGLGARTTVCSLPVTVTPKSLETSNQSEEEILYELVEGPDSPIQSYVEKGDTRNARLQTNLLANKLNTLQQNVEGQRLIKRQKIRRKLIKTLDNLPMRDQFEILQTTSAVVSSTDVPAELTQDSLYVSSRILDVVAQKIYTAKTTDSVSSSDMVTLAVQGTSNVLAAVTKETSSDRRKAKHIATTSTTVIHKLLTTELRDHVVGEQPVSHDTSHVSTFAARFKTEKRTTISSQRVQFTLPENMDTVLYGNSKVKRSDVDFSQKEICSGYQAQMVTFGRNPYMYGNKIPQLESVVASLRLYDCSGKELEVAGLPKSDEIQIRIPQDQNKNENVTEYILHKHEMNVHQFNVTAANLHEVLHILMKMTPMSQGRLFSVSLLISYEKPPSPRSFMLKKTFPRDENLLSIFLPPGSFNESGIYFLGIVDSLFDAGRPRPGEVRQRSYTLQMLWGQCLFWNSSISDWSSSGCEMKATSSYEMTDCTCNHLTAFGAEISLVPNDLDFSQVEDFFDLHENPVTFSLIAVVMVIYVILMVICRHFDVHDLHKGQPVPLQDNNQSDRFVYVVVVETGFRKNAGTSAKVSIVLHGEEGISETRELLTVDGQPLFERNSRDSFVMTLPESLGPIWKVQLWHNNAGASPSWYLSRVIVKDVNAGNNYYFLCEKWFAVEETDGKVEREVMVHEGSLGFKKVLWSKGAQYFIDYHLWCSMFTRPPRSRFTRAQRLTCCLALLLSYMCINAMWYHVSEKEYRGEFGLLDVSWRSVIVGVFTSLIVLPVNLFIVFLFRRSKVRVGSSSHKQTAAASELQEKQQEPAVVPSILDQSILNWQTLQEWAQKTWAKRYQQSVASSAESVKPVTQPVQQQTPPSDQIQQLENNNVQQVNTAAQDGSVDQADEQVQTAPPAVRNDDNQSVNHRSSCERSPVSNDETDSPKNDRSARENNHSQGTVQENSSDTPIAADLSSDRERRERQESQENDTVSNQNVEESASGQRSHSCSPAQERRDGNHRESSAERTSNRHEYSVNSEKSRLLRNFHSPPPSSENGSTESGIQITSVPRSTKKSRVFLPFWCVYVAWVLCVLVIGGCGTVTVLYGFRFGRTKSILWLQSLVFSFLSCVFFSHPLLILAVTLYTAMRFKDDVNVLDHHDDGHITDKKANERLPIKPHSQSDGYEECDDLEKGIAARQRSRYLRFARPPQEKQLIAARKSIMKEKKAYSCFWEGTIFAVIFILSIIITYGKFSTANFQLNKAHKNLLERTGPTAFSSIRSVSDWWVWLEKNFVDTLYWETWYNGEAVEGEGFLKYSSSYVIGEVNLRQLRVKETDCVTRIPYQNPRKCRYAYSFSEEDTTAFGVNNTWRHLSEEVTQIYHVWARHGYYAGSGHVLKMPAQKSEAVGFIQSLKEGGWVDAQTRALLVELTLLHAPTSLFSCVTLLLEVPPSGGVHPYSHVDSVYLFKYTNLFDNIVLACELIFIVAVFFKIRDLVCEMLRLKREFFQDLWNWLDVSISVMSLVFIVCFIYRFVLVNSTVEVFRSTYHEVFVDISFVALWDKILRLVCGILLFLLLVMSLKLLRHRNPFAKFGIVYKRASMDLASFALTFLFWLCVYTGLGMALYQSVSENFSTVDRSVVTLVALMTGWYSFPQINSHDPIGSKIFIVTYFVFVVGILTAHVIAILCFYYKVYQQEEELSMPIKDAVKLLCQNFIQWTGLKKTPPAVEQENILSPEFTLAEIEYQVDELLFRMNALAGTHGLPEKPPYYFTDSDCTYPGAEDGLSSGAGSEMRPFDDERFETRIQKIEDNLYSHEPHLAQLIKLNNIGADVLSQENEKQLRTQLELEIFRQLQLNRQDSNKEVNSPQLSADRNNVISLQESPPAHTQQHRSFPSPPNISCLGGEELADPYQHLESKTGQERSPRHKSAQRHKYKEGLLEGIPLKEISSASSCRQRTPPSSATGCETAETTLTESSPPTSSGASEVVASLHRSHRHKLPPIETINQLSNESIARAAEIAPPPGGTFAGYDDLCDSSSGSEHKKVSKTAGRRNLRKTKSRGKGKGSSQTISSIPALHDLSFDNDAYCTSDSDQENESHRTSGSSTQRKQCWS